MPTPKQYGSAAERQRAYRQRQVQAREVERQQKGLPAAPAIASLPGERRWKALLEHARSALSTVEVEMQDYYEARSETWQEQERGEAFQERMVAIETLLSELETLL